MTLVFQEPNDFEGVYLLEALLEACQGARGGGGAFAFATASGAKLLMEDEAFIGFTNKHKFDLVVGVDAITDTAALKVLTNAAARSEHVNVSVFMHDVRGALFHPKFCWFSHGSSGQLLVGSGNLTVGGLRGNWEAYSITDLDSDKLANIESQWSLWKTANSTSLLAPDDPRVLARALKNTGWVQLVRGERADANSPDSGGGKVENETINPVRDDGVILIAEIPKSGDRWNQANFDLDNYEGFFGAKRGTQRRILLQHVGQDGLLGNLESRPSVAVKSQNYRFELEAAAGYHYPKPPSRPIGVFIRVALRTFRYRLLMPQDSDYKKIETFLRQKWSGQTGRMRRIRTTVGDLRKAWPASALWQ